MSGSDIVPLASPVNGPYELGLKLWERTSQGLLGARTEGPGSGIWGLGLGSGVYALGSVLHAPNPRLCRFSRLSRRGSPYALLAPDPPNLSFAR
eukprot:3708766-Rhodomonas_salina.1